MKKLSSFVSFAIAAVAFALLTAPSFAWSEGGHKVVALIAYSELDEATRAKIVHLLQQHPLWEQDFASEMPAEITTGPESERQRWIFAQAAIWPDIARKHRAPPHDYHRATWHYINDPIFIDASVAEADWRHLRVNLSFEWSVTTDADLQNGPQTIEMARALLMDPAVSPREKAVMICWLFHVVGDLHQPLHCTTLVSPRVFRQGDKGGNGIELRKDGARSGKSLHSFWDGLLKTNVSLNQASETMASILREPDVAEGARAAAANLAVKDWVKEGKQSAQENVYTEGILDAVRAADSADGNQTKVVVTMPAEALADYGRAAGTVARQRAAMGGFRLGALLKDLFPQ